MTGQLNHVAPRRVSAVVAVLLADPAHWSPGRPTSHPRGGRRRRLSGSVLSCAPMSDGGSPIRRSAGLPITGASRKYEVTSA
jgi:hypothetical protein